MLVVAENRLGNRARGTFGEGANPDKRSLRLVTAGELMVPATQMLPGICGDDRCDKNGKRPLVPAAFGGLASLALTDALTTRRWYKLGMTFEQHVATMFADLRAQFPDAVFSLHTDTQSQAAQKTKPGVVLECGCAAVAKARAVVELLIEYRDMIDRVYADRVVVNAQELLQSDYFARGTAATVDRLCELGVGLEVLDGDHNGIVLVRNKRKGMVLDRAGLRRTLSQRGLPSLDPFEYDEWAMREAAKLLAKGDALSMVTINAIGHPDMVVVTIE